MNQDDDKKSVAAAKAESAKKKKLTLSHEELGTLSDAELEHVSAAAWPGTIGRARY